MLKNTKEVQSFFGLASFYRQFIPHFARKAWCLHELVGPTANKPKKKARAKGNEIAPTKPKIKPFEWMMKYQEVIWCTEGGTYVLLQYWDILVSQGNLYWREIQSLNGLGTIVSQQDKGGKIHVIAYASWSLCPSERSMCNCSSTKLELLALKWAVTEKNFTIILLGSQFQVYMKNNPLAHMCKIANWVHNKSDGLVSWHFFDFTIKYWTGCSNKATDALSHYPFNPFCDSKSETDSDEVEVISYWSVCKAKD